ncbi:MAG: ABC transporter permease [Firmicutes bacterium]|nr:ABC transporter permease [Bacillota bacterium]
MASIIQKWSRVFVFAAVFLLLAVASPYFLTRENLLNVVRQAALLTMLGIGQTMVIVTGGIDLSVGSVLALSSCVAAEPIKNMTTIWPGVGLALLIGLLCGTLNGALVAHVNLPPFVATYGLQWVARGAVLVYMAGHITYGFGPAFRFLGAGHVLGAPMPVVFMVTVFALAWFFMHRTTWGRNVYAVGANRAAADISGVRSARLVQSVYMINGLIVAFVGLLYISRLNAAEPVIGESFALESIAATLVGGTPFTGGEGGVANTVIGALILALMSNGMNLLGVSQFWQPTVLGAVIVLAIILDRVSKNLTSGEGVRRAA